MKVNDKAKTASGNRENGPEPLRSSGSIGADIRALRRSRGWTLSDLAERLDHANGELSRWIELSRIDAIITLSLQ